MPRKTKAELQAEATVHGLFFALLVAMAIAAMVFVLSPGMLVVAGLRDVSGASLSRGQMWTFSVLAAATYLCILGRARRDWKKAGVVYFQTCLGVVLVWAFAHYGLEASFPSRLLGYFGEDQAKTPVGSGTPVQVNGHPEVGP